MAGSSSLVDGAKGMISSRGSNHSSDDLRYCGEFLCGGAMGACCACRGGVGGGVRNAQASRTHPGNFGFIMLLSSRCLSVLKY